MGTDTEVEKPKGEVTRWSLFIVYFEDDKGKEYPSYQTPEEFKVTMLKQELTKETAQKSIDHALEFLNAVKYYLSEYSGEKEMK